MPIRTTRQILATLRCSRDISALPLLSQYVTPVWTIDRRKWDLRLYLLIASIEPLIVLWRPGYLQASMEPFRMGSSRVAVHVTNPQQGELMTTNWSEFL